MWTPDSLNRAPTTDLPLAAYRPRSQVHVPTTLVRRAATPVIDAHGHLGRWLTAGEWAVPDVGALVDSMDACNVRAIVNLDGRWGDELEANLARYDAARPGRFVTFCHVDWVALRHADAEDRLAADLRRSVAAGARGLKVWKDLGLEVRDGRGRLVSPNDPRLDRLWQTAAEQGIPVAIHTGDPAAFFEPVDRFNERLEELVRHPEWSYHGGDHPPLSELLGALEAVVARHPRTTFIGVHVGGRPEDLAWVDRMLVLYPNFSIDIAARVAELGRQPRAARALVLRHPDRVLFGSDGIPPGEADYHTLFRFVETADEAFDYSAVDPPPTGRWQVSALDLPADVQALVYAANCRRLVPGLDRMGTERPEGGHA